MDGCSTHSWFVVDHDSILMRNRDSEEDAETKNGTKDSRIEGMVKEISFKFFQIFSRRTEAQHITLLTHRFSTILQQVVNLMKTKLQSTWDIWNYSWISEIKCHQEKLLDYSPKNLVTSWRMIVNSLETRKRHWKNLNRRSLMRWNSFSVQFAWR